MAGPTDLYTQAQELLAASIDALDTIPISDPGLGGAPDRAFVAHAQPPLDCCDQLAVWFASITEAPTPPLELGAGQRHQWNFRRNYVAFRVAITRCMSSDQIPYPIDAYQADSEQAYADAWALWNYTWNLTTTGELFTICGGVYYDSLSPLTPSGGCYGSILNIRAEVLGYQNS
jgi:hypothetical protein